MAALAGEGWQTHGPPPSPPTIGGEPVHVETSSPSPPPRNAALGRPSVPMTTVTPVIVDARRSPYEPLSGTMSLREIKKRREQSAERRAQKTERPRRVIPPSKHEFSPPEPPVPLRPSSVPSLSEGQEAALVLTLPEPQRESGFFRPPARPARYHGGNKTPPFPIGSSTDSLFGSRVLASGGSSVGLGACACGVDQNLNPLRGSASTPNLTVAAGGAHPGRVPRLYFGDALHHVDAPRSPVRGSPPKMKPPKHAGQACAYGHWGEVSDPSALFSASPVPSRPPRPPGADCLPSSSMLQPPALPESPKAPGGIGGARGQAAAIERTMAARQPRGCGEGSRRASVNSLTSGWPATRPSDEYAGMQLPRSNSRSTMTMRPLRSVGKFSMAIDPSKLSNWQYRTLQRTKPDQWITKRAATYHPGDFRQSASSAGLGGASEAAPAPPPSAASTLFATPAAAPGASAAASGPAAAVDPAAAMDMAAEQAAALAGRGRLDDDRRVKLAATREEAAAFIAEAEHFIEFAEQALVHASPPGTRTPLSLGGESGGVGPRRGSQRKLGALPERAARETQPLSRGPSREGRPSLAGRAPMYVEEVEEDPFPEKLVRKLEGVPGVSTQMLRLMRRADWRVRAP